MEARYLQKSLDEMRYRLQAVIINRAFPIWLPQEIDSRDSENVKAGDPASKVREFFALFRDYHSKRYGLYADFAGRLSDEILLIRVPEYQQDVHGLKDLETLAGVLADVNSSECGPVEQKASL